MSTPNPLIPQGSLQSQGTSNVRVAVATIVAIHVVFFGGLLLQGCKRDTKTGDGATETNAPSTALTYPPIDSNSLYYSNAAALPPETPSVAGTSAPTGGISHFQESFVDTNTRPAQPDPWAPANLSTAAPAVSEEKPLTGKEYTVARGDSFSKIAKTQGTTLAALKKANPNVDPAKIRVGQKIVVPAGAPAASETATHQPLPGGTAPATSVYTVKAGDNLTKIARNHGVTVGQLRAANNLKVSRVNVGQKLKIPASTNTPAKSAPATASTNPTF